MQSIIKQIILNAGISKTQFAKDIEISKSHVLNVINGSKKCSRAMYENIRNLPYISEKTKTELDEAFYCDLFGKKDYEVIIYIIEQIENLENMFNKTSNIYIRKDFIKNVFESKDAIHMINGINELLEIVSFFTSKCLGNKEPFFFTNYSFAQSRLDNTLFTLFRDRDYSTEINFEHLILFDNENPKEIVHSVFNALNWSRVLLRTSKCISESRPDHQLLPYYIITNDCVILFDFNCENGVIFTADNIIDYYSKLFEDSRKDFTPICEVIYDEANCIGQSDYYSDIEDFEVSFGGIACLGPYLDYEILNKITPDIPNKDMLIRMLLAHYSSLFDVSKDEYISEESFWNFVEDGDLRVITDKYVSRCDYSDRIKILKNIYEGNQKADKLNIKLLDDKKLKIHESIGIECFTNATIITLLFRNEPCMKAIRPYSITARLSYSDNAMFRGLSEKLHIYFKENRYALHPDMRNRAFERMIAKCEGMKNDSN